MTVSKPSSRESHLRSILKGCTWRVIATMTTISIALAVTGTVDQALAIGGIEFFGKIVIYYGHERMWQLVPRGSIRKIYETPHDASPSESVDK